KLSIAATSPKRLVTPLRRTSAMGDDLVQRAAQRAPGSGVEQSEPCGMESESDVFAEPHIDRRRQAGLDLAVIGVERDDLGGAEVLGAEHVAANRPIVGQCDVLRAGAERERSLHA